MATKNRIHRIPGYASIVNKAKNSFKQKIKEEGPGFSILRPIAQIDNLFQFAGQIGSSSIIIETGVLYSIIHAAVMGYIRVGIDNLSTSAIDPKELKSKYNKVLESSKNLNTSEKPVDIKDDLRQKIIKLKEARSINVDRLKEEFITIVNLAILSIINNNT